MYCQCVWKISYTHVDMVRHPINFCDHMNSMMPIPQHAVSSCVELPQ
jgi:hypothetical protein